MAELNNCLLPDGLYYSVQDNVWVRDVGDNTIEIGMTDEIGSLFQQLVQ